MHDGLEFFLTYADNNAVGYFEKQGFTKEVTMDRERARARARRRPPRVCTTPVRNTEHTLCVLASGLGNAAAHARQTRQDICGCRGSDAEAMMLVSGARAAGCTCLTCANPQPPAHAHTNGLQRCCLGACMSSARAPPPGRRARRARGRAVGRLHQGL